MKAAIIDCGTNTFNLLIAEFRLYGDHRVLLNTHTSVKLGEGGLTNNLITPQAFQRGVKAFIELIDIAHDHKVDTIKAFATSAVRSTINGPDFVKEILDKTGVIIQVLNGDTEAQYVFKGVNLAIETLDRPTLVMDIGGGSTEFIIAEDQQVVWKKSFDLGASRLLQEFTPSDPILPNEIERLKEHFRDILHPLAVHLKKKPVQTLIGCAGSFESFAEMIKVKRNENTPLGKFFNFDNDDLKWLFHLLVQSTENDRKSFPGLVHHRVDTIVLASILVKHIIKKFKITDIIYSSYALKEGILADLISKRISI